MDTNTNRRRITRTYGKKYKPQDVTDSPTKILERLDWTDTLLTENGKQAIEAVLVDYSDIFARRTMDIGRNRDFNVKLAPKDDKSVRSQRLSCQSTWKKNLFVEVAMMYKYGTIMVLPFSKYASPIFSES